MKRTKRPLAALMILLACVVSFDEGLAQAPSTIPQGVPANFSGLNPAVIRSIAQTAASDINGIIAGHPATSTASCPSSPTLFEDCVVLGPPVTWFKWQTAGWQTIGTFSPNFVAASFTGAGVETNNLGNGGAPVTANYTIAATDCGQTIQAGTGSTGFFTITVPSVSGFPTNCTVVIANGDTTRGKNVSLGACNTQKVLWPGQTCKIGIVNGVWMALSRPGRWHSTVGVLNFFTDFSNGSDTKGAADGLAAGTSAFKSVQECLSVIGDQIDFDAVNQTQAICNMAAATTDTTAVHMPFHDLVGAQGGAAFQVVGASLAVSGAISNGGLCEITVSSTATYTLNEIVSVYGVGGATGCNGTWQVTVTDSTHLTLQSSTFGGSYTSGGTVTNGSVKNATGDSAFQCYFSTVIEFANIYFQANVSVFESVENCYAEIAAGNVFGGSPTGSLLTMQSKGQIHLFNDIGIASGAASAAIEANSSGLFMADSAVNINFLPGVNPTFGEFALATAQGQANFGSVTINLNGNTVTGKRCEADTLALVNSSTGTPNSYFPGNSNCTTSVGGQAN